MTDWGEEESIHHIHFKLHSKIQLVLPGARRRSEKCKRSVEIVWILELANRWPFFIAVRTTHARPGIDRKTPAASRDAGTIRRPPDGLRR
jgi:hypothetical protein